MTALCIVRRPARSSHIRSARDISTVGRVDALPRELHEDDGRESRDRGRNERSDRGEAPNERCEPKEAAELERVVAHPTAQPVGQAYENPLPFAAH